MSPVRQRSHVGGQQRQARARVDDQLAAGAVVPQDGLAALEGGQACAHVLPKHVVCISCALGGSTSVHAPTTTSGYNH